MVQIDENKLAAMITALTNNDNIDTSVLNRDSIEINDEELTSFHFSQNVFTDVNTSIFFLRELEYIQRQSRDTKQKKLKGMLLVPVSTEAPEWSEYITYRRLTRVGRAKVITDYSHDFPRADIYREEFTIKVKGLGSSYGYSKNEILQARQTGVSLDRERAISCKRAIDEEQDDIIWNGNTTYNIQGFIDYPGFSSYTIPNGAGGTADWASKTPDEILADMNGIVTTIISTTNGIEQPDTMIMPIDQWRDISTRRLSDSDSETVLSFFLKTNGIIRTVDWAVELNAAGVGGTDRMMVYPKSPDYFRVEIPMMYKEEPPQQKGKEFEVVAEQRTAGILVYYPLAFAYADGI
jgi:hypothetical protein